MDVWEINMKANKKVLRQALSLTFISALILTACQQPEPPPVLTATIGTYNYQIEPNTQKTLVGTSVLLRVRTAKNERIPENRTISIIGSNDWNGSKVLTIDYPKNADWVLYNNQNIPATIGKFNIQLNPLPNQTSQVNTSKELLTTTPLPLIEFETVSGSRNTVTGQWKPLANTESYFCRLLNGTDQIFLSNVKYIKDTQVTLDATQDQFSTLNPDKAHLLVVYAANFDTTTDDAVLPQDLLISDSARFFDVIEPASQKAHTKASRVPRETVLIKY